ncbi:TIGR03013 family XrtA/PEP-CTERM system glycosyltransferase [Qipengyuania soli]|uniref:TIGR03013 family PEP-CTERM/XrtA system glycosyltransferase n=1 Tax=Qipengyuania soli TaxID=2782568 RepID=A0A7S8IT93_9SPHN|nr:TIGR03013 family XrtA/PEP-CTERM system glycosyltransferase [Qipengyuania soli]QPC99843.1 TIGR03013 family PEP-CTERM/XrtA system glycosyltransferase [Qipengyuania soli]
MIRLFKHYISYNVVLLGILDLLVLVAAGEVAWRIRITQIGSSIGLLENRLIELSGFALVTWLTMIAVGAYSPEALRSIRFAASRMLVAILLGVGAIAIANFILPGSVFWRSILFYATIIAFFGLVISRYFAERMIGIETFRRRILVLGSGKRAARLMRLSKRPGSGFIATAFVDMGDCTPEIEHPVPRQSIQDFGRYVERLGASEVVLALEERRNSLPLKELLRIKTKGVNVNDYSSFIERETGRVDLDTLNPSWLIFSDGFSAEQRISRILKRGFDVAVSLVILVVALPLIVIFAAAVKLESKGPAFFRQRRVGLYGEDFTLIKLRSMRTDAEANGAKWAEENDPRITRIGRIIRKVRIDELPQLWSVLKGEMSFVGPRPEVPHFVADLERELPYYAERHVVKPGITGWAQINYPYGASIEDARHKLEYDLYYAKNYTPFLDILILLQTARVILWPAGAR